MGGHLYRHASGACTTSTRGPRPDGVSIYHEYENPTGASAVGDALASTRIEENRNSEQPRQLALKGGKIED